MQIYEFKYEFGQIITVLKLVYLAHNLKNAKKR